ncbi:MAG TPA: magnesium transporter [Polyangiaceae bacterium]
MRLARLIGPELLALVSESPGEVAELLDEVHPEDIAEIIAELDDDRSVKLITTLPNDYAAQVFARLDEKRQERLTELMGAGSVARIATEMDADDRADFFSILPPSVHEPLLEELEKVDPEAAEDVEELVRWPDGSAGALMTTDYVSVTPDLRLEDAINVLRSNAKAAETVESIYVVDKSHKLVGMLTLRQLLISKPEERVKDVMITSVITVAPELDQEEAAKILAKYDLHTMPVVQQSGKMVGVITSDDIIDVVVEEQAEDVQKFGGMEALDAPYLQTGFWSMIKKRGGWLAVLFLGEMITASAMADYEHDVARAVVLALFVPLIISSGGNSGSQASTLIIRAMAIGEVKLRDWWRIVGRELRAGLVLGLALGCIGVLRIVAWQALFKEYGEHYGLIAATVGISLVGVVAWGTIAGSMLPFVLRRLGLDPASASAPFVATLVDVLGLVIYFETARLLLAGSLL